MKKSIMIGIILLIICLSLVIIKEIKEKNIHYTNIHDITNSGSKKEEVNVSLDTTYVAGSISSNNNYGYYVMFGDGVQYIVYMKHNDASKISAYLLDNTEESYKIFGITRKIPTNLEEPGKKFVKEWLDHNHTHEEGEIHSHDVSTDDFYHYFGYVYLDSRVNENIIYKIVIYLSGIMGVLFILYYVNIRYHFI